MDAILAAIAGSDKNEVVDFVTAINTAKMLTDTDILFDNINIEDIGKEEIKSCIAVLFNAKLLERKDVKDVKIKSLKKFKEQVVTAHNIIAEYANKCIDNVHNLIVDRENDNIDSSVSDNKISDEDNLEKLSKEELIKLLREKR